MTTTSKAKGIGTLIGRAIARDVLADGMSQEWTGLDAQDGDQAQAEGIKPGTPEWEEMEQAAKRAYAQVFAEISGKSFASEYAEEYGVSPSEDGAENVGDWDSTAWESAQRELKSKGVDDDNHAACLAAFRYGFFGERAGK